MGTLSVRSDVALPDDLQRRLNLWKGVGALGLVALWGYFGFIRNAEVPVLQFLDIAVHEMGHKVFSPFSETTMLMMGSGSQMLFPLAVGLVYGVWKRDLIAWGICWAWAASAFADASRYMADAVQGSLVLLGGTPDGLGDWERIFGPEHWDKMYLAEPWAHNTRVWGEIIWFASLGLVLGGMWWNWHRLQADERRERGPVRATVEPSRPLAPIDDEQMWR
jgi:hypothetical protein